eukprot:1363564-Pyramimonas_sp.AAC.1
MCIRDSLGIWRTRHAAVHAGIPVGPQIVLGIWRVFVSVCFCPLPDTGRRSATDGTDAWRL